MEKIINIVGFTGSLRRDSYNKAALNAAKELLPAGANLEIADLSPIPFFNEDLESEGIPEAVVQFKRKLAEADAILISTPEYNYSIPPVLKNAFQISSEPATVAVSINKNNLTHAYIQAGKVFSMSILPQYIARKRLKERLGLFCGISSEPTTTALDIQSDVRREYRRHRRNGDAFVVDWTAALPCYGHFLFKPLFCQHFHTADLLGMKKDAAVYCQCMVRTN